MSRASISFAAVAGGLGVLVLVPTAAWAEQFTFFDAKVTATEQNSSSPRAHYNIREGGEIKLTQPDNWTSPIDYTKGTIVIELESIEKPSAEVTQIDVCFLTSKGYGCRNTTHYSKPGRYQLVRPMPTGFNNYQNIDWTKKITHVQLVTKDGANNNGGRDLKQFFPHTTRIAVSFVSPGGTYTLPPGWTSAPGADAGTSGPSDAGSTTPEVGTDPADVATTPPTTDVPVSTPSTGGASGAAGAGATGGTSGSGGAGGTGGGSSPSTGGASGGSGGRGGGSGTARPDAAAPPPSSGGSQPSKSGACAIAGRGEGAALPSTFLVGLGLGLVALAVRRRPGARE